MLHCVAYILTLHKSVILHAQRHAVSLACYRIAHPWSALQKCRKTLIVDCRAPIYQGRPSVRHFLSRLWLFYVHVGIHTKNHYRFYYFYVVIF